VHLSTVDIKKNAEKGLFRRLNVETTGCFHALSAGVNAGSMLKHLFHRCFDALKRYFSVVLPAIRSKGTNSVSAA